MNLVIGVKIAKPLAANNLNPPFMLHLDLKKSKQ